MVKRSKRLKTYMRRRYGLNIMRMVKIKRNKRNRRSTTSVHATGS